MSRRSAKLAITALALCGANAVAPPALGTDADRERLVTTPPEIATRGKMATHVCPTRSSYENEAGQQVELGRLPCTTQFAPLLAVAGDTLAVRTPRSARAVGLSVDGVLWSATRVCGGLCPTRDGQGSFSPPDGACRSRIRVARGDRLDVTVVTRVGDPCRIR